MSASTPLLDVWDAAAGAPFHPLISKDSQFYVAFLLLFTAIFLTSIFALNRSFVGVPLLGLPASLAFSFGVLFMICAVGVYI